MDGGTAEVLAVGAGERRNGHGQRSGRAPRPGRPLPGGRAVLGGFLVAAALVGLFWASSHQSSPRQPYVVARHAVAPGARLGAADLALRPLDLPPDVAARAFRDVAEVEGAVAVAPLGPGELVQASAIVAKPSGPASREVSFPVPAATLGPGLGRGERIDVVATFGTGTDAFSTVVLRQAVVVALERGSRDARDVTVTVAVDDPAEVVAVAHASRQAELTVVRATGAAPLGPAGPFRVMPPSPSQAARS